MRVNELPQTFGKFFNDKISQIRQGIDNASLSPPSYTEFQGECLSDFRCVTEESGPSLFHHLQSLVALTLSQHPS